MFDLPLHPIVVHLPIGGTLLLVPFAILLAFLIHKKCLPSWSFSLATLLSAVVSLSAYMAMNLGGQDWEKVEKFVPKEALEEHAHNGDRFFYFSLGAFALFALVAYLHKHKWSNGLRWLSCLVALVLAAQMVVTGHTGGKLIYQYKGAEGHTQNSH